MKSTIVFYTHNLLFPNLLKETVKKAFNHAEHNECNLIIVSHYPILKEYIDVSEELNGTQDNNLPEQLKKFCVKDMNFTKEDFSVNYVTGKMPYVGRSILKQLIFAANKCETSNMILFEHDCFYPDNYVKVVENKLDAFDMTYCLQNYNMLNKRGFFKCEPHAFLSSFSGRASVLLSVFLKKMEIYTDKVKLLEPVVPYDLIIKEINWKDKSKNRVISKLIRPKTYKDLDARIVGNTRTHADKEPITENSCCVDAALGEKNTILELQHGLNTSNSLSLMRNVYDNSELEEEYRIPSQNHDYWGDSKYFLNMFEEIEKNELIYKIHKDGIHVCNL